MGRDRKHPEHRVRGSQTPTFAIVSGAPTTIPEPPKGLTDLTLRWWNSFWSSDVAQIVDAELDIRAVIRLARAYDFHEKCMQVVSESPLVEGSRKQFVKNPAAALAKDARQEIEKLEDRFGLTPKSRLNLGIEESGAPGLDQINAVLQGRIELDDEEEDPRAAM